MAGAQLTVDEHLFIKYQNEILALFQYLKSIVSPKSSAELAHITQAEEQTYDIQYEKFIKLQLSAKQIINLKVVKKSKTLRQVWDLFIDD